jgi:hypothetical protein
MERCRRAVAATVVGAALLLVSAPAGAAPAPEPPAAQTFGLEVLSSPAEMVTGGDALVQVRIPQTVPPHQATVRVNGRDVTRTLTLDPRARTLTGMIRDLQLGTNTLRAEANGNGRGRPVAELTLTNHPTTGPIFSGPQQQPFVCKTQTQGLGWPLIDNQVGVGMRIYNTPGDPSSGIAGWSADCSVATQVDYLYRTTGGAFLPLPPGDTPANMAQTTTIDGRTVDFVVRRERGTINRFIYSIAMLAPAGDPGDPPDTSLWNRRLVYGFDGGVAVGYNQGTLGGNALGNQAHTLGLGHAVVYSTGGRTNVHYNLVLGAETAIMTKERFIEGYGVPLYTVGIGASGGAIQQYVYAQNHPGVILDAAIPVYSYPDMVTQTIHVGDCELLEHYMDVTDGGNSKWATWANRTWLEGMAASSTIGNPYRGGLPGLTECVRGWRGLTPLAMNPLYGTAGAGSEHYDPAVLLETKWTHWDDVRNVYGVDADGYGRSTWDNVGVQYGLGALKDGNITPAEFLHLNATAGSWKESKDMIQEGCPFFPAPGCSNPATWDPWSRRQMRLSPDNGVTPAPRRTGDLQAMNAAYTSGLYFRGAIDIPIIDWRHYLEHVLDMHNSHQSFAARQRMLNHDGDASNQVIWFTDGRPSILSDAQPQAFAVIDEWMANIRANPGKSVAENKPAGAVDACFTATGAPIAMGAGVWAGILDGGAAGPCTQAFPLFSTSRIVAGGPIEGGVYKCALKPVATALADGTYAPWIPDATDAAWLQQIFPTGVCDYSKPDVGRPAGW